MLHNGKNLKKEVKALSHGVTQFYNILNISNIRH